MAVVAGGLTGCSSGGDADPPVVATASGGTTVVATPTPTPTPTPTLRPPERPAAMGEVSEAGAEAVARYFLELYPYVYATGDLADWEALSHPECVFCASVVGNVEEQVAAGHTADGGEIMVQALEVVPLTDGHFGVTATIGQAASAEYDSRGNAVSTSPEDTAKVTFAIWSSEAGLLVREVQVDPVTA